MIEIWQDVEEVGGYLVSNTGRVKSTKRKQDVILKPKIDKDGYHEYGLCCSVLGKTIYRRGHRLVAKAFLPNPDNLPVINHLNNVKDDNRVSNLEWCTVAHNTIHGYRSNPDKRVGRGFSDLSQEDLILAVKLYQQGSHYSQLNDYFQLDTAQDLWSDIFRGRRYSSVTGITTDIRDGRNPSQIKSDTEVLNILEEYYMDGKTQTEICNKFNFNPSYVSRIVNGKKRTTLFNSFMEDNNIGK